jgi:hypothetical protein
MFKINIFLQKPFSFHVPHSRQLYDSQIYYIIAFIDKKTSRKPVVMSILMD